MAKTFGLPLSSVAEVPDKIRTKLRALSIDTAEELVALIAVKDASKLLSKYLGVSDKELSDYVGKTKKTLPSRVASAMEEPYIQVLETGALEPPAEMRSKGPGPYESMVAAAALPPNVNHISRFRPIQSQGNRGTCVAFACTALNEDYHRYDSGGPPSLSEQCLYKRCKENDGAPNAVGTFVSVGMDCLVRFGECTEVCEPYNPNLPHNQPGPHPACCPPECLKYKIPTSLKLNENSVTDIKAALADGKPVAFAIPVYASWHYSAAVKQTGNITMPIPGELVEAGHAMLFVGYQDDPNTPGGGYFILRNSWGTSWGYNDTTYGAGYGTLPYQYMTDYGWEAYTTDVALPKPKPVCQPRPLLPCPIRPVTYCPPRPILKCPPRPVWCAVRPYRITCPPIAKIWENPWEYDYYSYPQYSSEYYPEDYYQPESYPEVCPCCGAPLQEDPTFTSGQFNPQMKPGR